MFDVQGEAFCGQIAILMVIAHNPLGWWFYPLYFTRIFNQLLQSLEPDDTT